MQLELYWGRGCGSCGEKLTRAVFLELCQSEASESHTSTQSPHVPVLENRATSKRLIDKGICHCIEYFSSLSLSVVISAK